MQTEAIIGAALEVKKETGAELVPEIMIPLVNSEAELKYVKHIVTLRLNSPARHRTYGCSPLLSA